MEIYTAPFHMPQKPFTQWSELGKLKLLWTPFEHFKFNLIMNISAKFSSSNIDCYVDCCNSLRVKEIYVI